MVSKEWFNYTLERTQNRQVFGNGRKVINTKSLKLQQLKGFWRRERDSNSR